MQINKDILYTPTEDKLIKDNIYKTNINGLYYIGSSLFPDNRGFFRGVTLIPDMNEIIGESFSVQQINHSRSNTSVVRGIHAENWNKLITVASGIALCVLADVRSDSPTFKNVEYFLFGIGEDAVAASLYISKGIGNSLCVIEGPVDYIYFFDKLYRDRDPKGDTAISLFDPDLNIQWPLKQEEMIISDRDKQSITIRELYPDIFK
jgi:dTDP-4-dehydrorhamnose 3,5-epimerase